MSVRYEWVCRALSLIFLVLPATAVWAHGTVLSPVSRVYRVYESNPEIPNFELAANAIATDGTQSYYTWMELSRNIPAAVNASLPAGFDYSPWVPDGHLASGGRFDPNSSEYPRTYAGLDQVSADWPTTPVTAGQPLAVDFYATTPHEPSVWDVWMTTADWNPSQPLNWGQMEFLGRPDVTLTGNHYYFDVTIPANRTGHQVLWVAWQRDDPVGEVFFSTSDLLVAAATSGLAGDFNNDSQIDAADYTAWRDAMTAGSTTLANDPTPGTVNESDFAYWRAHFGQSTGKGAGAAAVPEPATCLSLFVGMLGGVMYRWKRAARRRSTPA